jgi:phosphopantothenoylcysteine decarboxylase/phosphopantothenate--cysteine ligase
MGYSLAEVAAARGARVVLISGPVRLPEPAGVTRIQVRTAVEMRSAVMAQLPEATIILKAAAVADYFLAEVPQQKMKKTAARLSLELDPTPDILAEAGRKKGDRLLVGFAAETQNLVAEARRKLETKNCDMVVANRVDREGLGFDSDENELTIVTSAGDLVELPRASKKDLADRIFDEILKLRLALHAAHES